LITGRRQPSSTQWGFDAGVAGLTAAAMIDARHGDLDVLWSNGGNFLDVLPAPTPRSPACAARQTHVTHQMLVGPARR
jgi:hypothetical protein